MRVHTTRSVVRQAIGRHLWDPTTVFPQDGGWTLDLAGKCERPVIIELVGHPDWHELRKDPDAHRLYADAAVRCRRCAWCLRQRASLWAQRAKLELQRAPRTWFVTLTLSPENHHRLFTKALLAGRSADTAELEFQARAWAIGLEITKYIKRLRKSGGSNPGPVRFRYAMVAEKHSGKRKKRVLAQSVEGFPHYHFFLHETFCQPMRMRKVLREDGSILHDKNGRPYWTGAIAEQWPFGHVVCKEVDVSTPGAAGWYLSKYLSKDASCRVRASRGYGASSEQDLRSLNIGSWVPSMERVSTRIVGDSLHRNTTTGTPKPVTLDPSVTAPLWLLPLSGGEADGKDPVVTGGQIESEVAGASVSSGVPSRREGGGLCGAGFQTPATAPEATTSPGKRQFPDTG